MSLRVVLLISLLLPFCVEAQEGSFDSAVWRLAAKVRRSNAKIVVYEIEAPPQMARLARKLRCKLEEALVRQEQTVLTRDLQVILDEQKMRGERQTTGGGHRQNSAACLGEKARRRVAGIS
jgi:hypothetical protein